MNVVSYSQNVNLRDFRLLMTESAIWSEITQGSQGSLDTNNKWACRKPTASQITPIDPSRLPSASPLPPLCPSSPPLAEAISGNCTVTTRSLERWAGDPWKSGWHSEARGTKWCPGAVAEASVGSKCWPGSLRLFFLLFLTYFPSACLFAWLSLWIFDTWRGHKAEEGPGDAPRLSLLSKAAHSPFFSPQTVYCWNSAQKMSSHFWPPQKHIKMTDVRNRNKCLGLNSLRAKI